MECHQKSKPMVIGLYGVPGSGKSFLLAALKNVLDPTRVSFFEGSQVLASLVAGDRKPFEALSDADKALYRSRAILSVRTACASDGSVGVVTGHYMFWSPDSPSGNTVCTAEDLEVFTHILYVRVDPQRIANQRENDTSRVRPFCSVAHLAQSQEREIDELRQLCLDKGILFSVLRDMPDAESIARLIQDLTSVGKEILSSRVCESIDELVNDRPALETVVVFDADKTLAPDDAGELFWRELQGTNSLARIGWQQLQRVFAGPLGYSDYGFCQAALLYGEAASSVEYERLCLAVAAVVRLYAPIESLLKTILAKPHIGVIVATCGLRRVWKHVLAGRGFDNVLLLGNGQEIDEMVTPIGKEAIVGRLKHRHGLYVWAFGDSPLDIPMMSKADEAIVVVGAPEIRSKTMEAALQKAMMTRGLVPRFVLMPPDTGPSQNSSLQVEVSLNEETFIQSLTRHHEQAVLPRNFCRLLHATNKPATKLLTATTRDASIAGPSLRAAHYEVGKYLALEYLTKLLVFEEYTMTHVEGKQTLGHRILGGHKTTIVALMRGGEPLALGINEIVPNAMFVHAHRPSDLQARHVKGQRQVILVDSVINNGTTMREFVKHTRALDTEVRVIAVTEVIQRKAAEDFEHNDRDISLVALRMSENKFTGTKGTDTGNRLYNTTHMK